jgi:hypothetical protein
MMGGRCDGSWFVDQVFADQQYQDCRGCMHHELDPEEGFRCKVLHGGEALMECPELQGYVASQEIKLYGVNAPPKKGPLRFRR